LLSKPKSDISNGDKNYSPSGILSAKALLIIYLLIGLKLLYYSRVILVIQTPSVGRLSKAI
jgi:hypothetical protein